MDFGMIALFFCLGAVGFILGHSIGFRSGYRSGYSNGEIAGAHDVRNDMYA